MTQITGTLANYQAGGPVGILPNQSMFVTDASRQGQFDARSSFVRMLNIIFARNPIAVDRSLAVEALNVTTPINPYLSWRQAVGTTHVEPIPPMTEWQYQVFTLEERDFLLLDTTFIGLVLSGAKPRVLVNGLGYLDGSQWMVYEADQPIVNNQPVTDPNFLANNPSLVFKLAKSYDFEVIDFNTRDNLLQASPPITLGQRVLVDGNTSTNGFWTVWEYVGTSNPNADSTGFLLTRYQTYDTSDFWGYVDWYATGFNANNAPVVSYATAGARDAVENPNPSSPLVKINDNGSGNWQWTEYQANTSTWNVVAQGNGTIAFSSTFYDNPSLPTIGLDPITYTDIGNFPNRDGSWEFQVMFDQLQDDTLLEPAEVNEVFFSILHFVHAQQDQVAWAFKTSFMTIGGYNETLTATPVQPIDITNSVTEYIQEIAPYRVHIRDFTQVLTPPLDNAAVHVSDFDFPLYYDANTNTYRNLDITNPTDLNIVQTTQPWLDWYNTYQNVEFRPAEYVASLWNGVRHFNITMTFDRIDHMPLLASQVFTFDPALQNPLVLVMNIDLTVIDMRTEIVELFWNGNRVADSQFVVDQDDVSLYFTPATGDTLQVNIKQNLTSGAAADRIQQFYEPNILDPEKNLLTLMGLNFKGNIDDGGDLANNSLVDYGIDGVASGTSTDESINPDEHHFGLADPDMDANRPEELIATGTGESLQIYYTNVIANTTMLISTARPATDLMAPNEVGDFDARPLDVLLYDVGFAQEDATVGNSVVPSSPSIACGTTFPNQVFNPYAGQDRDLEVFRRDAFDYTDFTNPGGVLENDVLFTDNTIVIATSNGMTFTVPVTEELATGVANAPTNVSIMSLPGVVWINNERIEFFEYSNTATSVTLGEVRRGTHYTRIGVEQRSIANYKADSVTKTFLLPGVTSTANVSVVINGPVTDLNGNILTSDGYTGFNINSAKNLNIDYTLTALSNGISVSFTKAPATGSTIYLSSDSGAKHPAGSRVYDGLYSFFPIEPSLPVLTEVTWITSNTTTLIYTTSNSVSTTSVLAVSTVGSVSYSLANGSVLPPGWALSGNVLSGPTPNSVGTTYTANIVATANTVSVTQDFTITVPALPIPSVVQGQVRALNTTETTTVTFGNAVAIGHVLVAMVASNSVVTPSAGWTTLQTHAGQDNLWIGYHNVVSGDGTVFTPTSVTGGGSISVWEIANSTSDWAVSPPTFLINGG